MKPAKYRKKPVVIEAMQWDGSIGGAAPIIKWALANDGEVSWSAGYESFHDGDEWIPGREDGIYIHTLEGKMLATAGDFIIKGVQGEFYPCKPDIFDATYEAV